MITTEFNKYQTPLTEENIRKQFTKVVEEEPWTDEDVRWVDTQIRNDIGSIIFLQNLVSKDRRYAKDMPKDEDGKIIVDFSNPHILENMDYFRPMAKEFERTGKYTSIKKSHHPMSRYVRFWKEQVIQSLSDMVREDGEWIPGELYWYWNFVTIKQTVETKIKGKKVTTRSRKPPRTYEGDYLWFHYKDMGKVKQKHSSLLKARGIGYSIKESADLARDFILGANLQVYEDKDPTQSYAIADSDEFLVKDGILNKFVDAVDWCAKHTEFPRIRKLKDSLSDKHWQMGWKKGDKLFGSLNEVIGVTIKNDPQKARGKRGSKIKWEEVGSMPGFITAWQIARPSVEDGDAAFGFMIAGGCLTENNYVWNNQGDLVKIKDLNKNEGIIGFNYGKQIYSKENITYWQPPKNKECIRIETNTGRFIECSTDHPLLTSHATQCRAIELPKENGKRKRYIHKTTKWTEAKNVKIGDQLSILDELPVFSNKQMWNPRLVGWLIGDGCYGYDKTPVLSNCESEINNYVHTNLNYVTEKTYVTKDGKIYEENRIKNICPKLRELGIYGQTKTNKRLPNNIHSYSKESICEFIGGLYDADGYIDKTGRISISQAGKEILLELQLLLQKLGIHGNIIYKKPNLNNPKSKNGHYELEIGDKTSVLRFVENIKLYPKHKQDRLNSFIELYRNKKSERDTFNTGLRFERIVKIENIGIQPVYNLTAGTTHTYVGNGIVTHNTGGAEIKDFQGLYKAFYEPSTLNIFGIPNVYDRKADGKKKVGFFWGAYLNRFDCANHDGVSDIIKALIQIYVKRWSVKQSSDPNLYIQAKAELPITPQEAVLRKEGSIFPVNDLRIYLENDINSDLTSFISPHYVGELKRNSNGVVDWKLSVEHNPIRQYPLPRTTDSTGAVEIFVMPQIDSTGEIPWGRYISGIDPYDQDTGTSLGSMFIFDLWTDKIVAEYTGRPRTANEFYENCLRLLQFYNAQANYENNLKGLFVYFDNNNALKYLCDTPQILRDMEYVKGTKIGNSAKGTRANEYVNKYARKLVADWMVHSRKVGEGENEKTILNLHTIRSIGLIEEALMWTEDGNYDRISAIGMLFILRESMVKHTEASMSYDEDGDISLSDPFFTGDYTEALIQKSLRQSEKVFNDKDFKKHISTRESQGFMDI